jgi:hypothetical protein
MGMRVKLVLAAAMMLPLLAGCGGGSGSRLPVACPTPGLLAEGADLTRYQPGPIRDLTTQEYDARLTGLSGSCTPGRDDRSIEMQLSVGFSVERGVVAEGREVDLPWFVAVMDRRDDRILNRVAFTERAVFARNETQVAVQGAPVSLSLPVGEGRSAQDYRILVSFALTGEELALNRRRGSR